MINQRLIYRLIVSSWARPAKKWGIFSNLKASSARNFFPRLLVEAGPSGR